MVSVFWVVACFVSTIVMGVLYFTREEYLKTLKDQCDESEQMLNQALKREANAIDDKLRLIAQLNTKTRLLDTLSEGVMNLAKNIEGLR